MAKEDVKRSVQRAVATAWISKHNPPKRLSGNGPCCIASDLEAYLGEQFNISQIHGAPLHPQTQGKIEKYHRSMKNVVKLNNY